MSFNDGLSLSDLEARQADVFSQMVGWREPELRFTLRVRYMDMNPWLFPRKEEQPDLTVADDCGSHS